MKTVDGKSRSAGSPLHFSELSSREKRICLRILSADRESDPFKLANTQHYGYVLWGPFFFLSYDASVLMRSGLHALRRSWFLRRVAARHGGARLSWPPDIEI
ncbi:hypothetical protein [Streptomyces geranii]|uniref:hypothetical protein n=1 Tax=Streptomyces geranii TaxID=2058923 RepID=UPI001300A741|nr:hypothetical protein [Streptomyces geranii]